MRKYSTPLRVVDTGLSDDLPLFRWASFRPASPKLSRASQRIAKRFGLSPSLTRACAELAGLPTETTDHV